MFELSIRIVAGTGADRKENAVAEATAAAAAAAAAA